MHLVYRFTTIACYWNSIYQELKKVKAWNGTVWNIMVQGHQSLAVAGNRESQFVVDRGILKGECQGLWLGLVYYYPINQEINQEINLNPETFTPKI